MRGGMLEEASGCTERVQTADGGEVYRMDECCPFFYLYFWIKIGSSFSIILFFVLNLFFSFFFIFFVSLFLFFFIFSFVSSITFLLF